MMVYYCELWYGYEEGILEQRIYVDGVFVDPDWPRKLLLLCRAVGLCGWVSAPASWDQVGVQQKVGC